MRAIAYNVNRASSATGKGRVIQRWLGQQLPGLDLLALTHVGSSDIGWLVRWLDDHGMPVIMPTATISGRQHIVAVRSRIDAEPFECPPAERQKPTEEYLAVQLRAPNAPPLTFVSAYGYPSSNLMFQFTSKATEATGRAIIAGDLNWIRSDDPAVRRNPTFRGGLGDQAFAAAAMWGFHDVAPTRPDGTRGPDWTWPVRLHGKPGRLRCQLDHVLVTDDAPPVTVTVGEVDPLEEMSLRACRSDHRPLVITW